MEPGKISERQLVFLLLAVMFSVNFFSIPQIEATMVQQDAWIITILPATVLTIITVLMITAVGGRFPALTLTEYLPLILGKPLGKVLGMIYALFFILLGSLTLKECALFLSVTIMPRTPEKVLMITLMIVVFYGVRSGLEVVARVCEFLLPIMMIVILAVIILPYNIMDFRRLLPLAQHPHGSMILATLIGTSNRAELFVMVMLLPALNETRHINRNIILSIILVGVIFAAGQIGLAAVFGGAEVANMEFPLFSLARMINLARIITRLESILVLVWIFGMFLKMAAITYAAMLSTSQIMGFKDPQRLLFPVILLIIAFADNSFANIVDYADFSANSFPFIAFSFEFLIPLILGAILLIKAKTGRNHS